MKVNEVEKLLNITRANIRYYEKEGLLRPERHDNSYREYSEDDVARLRTIILLRKLDIQISDIRNLFDGEKELQDVLQDNIVELTEKIEMFDGALNVCKKLKAAGVDINSLDSEYYLDLVSKRESSGKKFADILHDYAKYEVDVLDRIFRIDPDACGNDTKKRSSVIIILSTAVVLIVSGALTYINTGNIKLSIVFPLVGLLLISLAYLPYFIRNGKIPTINVDKVLKVNRIITLSLLVMVLLGVIVFLVIFWWIAYH